MTEKLLESLHSVHEHLEDVADLCCLLLISGSDRTLGCVRALTELVAWHLDTEEEFILPLYSEVEDQYPAASRCEHIRADHEKIGQTLEAMVHLEGVALLRALRRLHHLFEHHNAREALGLERFIGSLDHHDSEMLQDMIWDSLPLGVGDVFANARPVVVMWQEHLPPPAVSSDPTIALDVAIHQTQDFAEAILRCRPREEWLHQLLVLTGDVVLQHADGVSDARMQRLLRGQVRKLRSLAWKMRQSVDAERQETLGGKGLLQAIDRADTAVRVLKHMKRAIHGQLKPSRRSK